MANAASADEVFAAATAMKEQFENLKSAIDDQVEEIFRNATSARRDPTAAEKAQIESLRADQDKIDESLEALAFATLRKLDNSADIATLRAKLKEVSAGLKDDLKRLKNIARYAEIAGKVADALTKLAEMAAKAAI
jgi:hypothetical protein